MYIADALNTADEQGMDLVQVGQETIDDTDVPVCKIFDYSKYLYDQEKKKRQSAKNRCEIKEIRLGPNTAINDLRIKATAVSRILKEGDKVKISIQYKGREMNFIKSGLDKLNKFDELIEVSHTVDVKPKIEGNRVYMLISNH